MNFFNPQMMGSFIFIFYFYLDLLTWDTDLINEVNIHIGQMQVTTEMPGYHCMGHVPHGGQRHVGPVLPA